ncbi:MAG: AraC family transcriptional regulator [Proteobacteria bacterium]|nr:AraC family transcriptional regulator [Pseudomonadota bacterium]
MDLSSDDTLKNEYVYRLNRTIDYIQHHYAEDLNLSKLADVACFSRYHFHRIFRALMGETVNEFVRRVRLEKAAIKLTLDKYKSITEIAFESGFSSSQNFARCFKAHYGVTPSNVRTELNWETWLQKMKNLEASEMQEHTASESELTQHYRYRRKISIEKVFTRNTEMNVCVMELPSYRVAYVRNRGPYTVESVRSAFGKLMQWANPRGLVNTDARVIGVAWSNPDLTPQKKLLFDACITVPDTVKADNWVNIQTLTGGKFAIHHCEIDTHHQEEEWLRLLYHWLATSDYQPDDRPTFNIYYNDIETHPLKHAILDLCLPIKPLKS